LFKRRRRKSDQVKPCHDARDLTEPATERYGEMKRERLLPVDVPAKYGDYCGEKGETRRGNGDRHRQAHDPLHATQVDDRKKKHDARCK
jgi:hypothetical protein